MKKRIAIIMAVFTLCMTQLADFASAASLPDLTLPCSLTIEMKFAEQSIAGAQVTIYHVAETLIRDGNMELELTTAFSGSGADLQTIDTTAGNLALARVLSAYVRTQGIVPGSGNSQVTDANGHASFVNLKPGLYLVTTGSMPGYLDMAPYLLLLPISADGETWVYDVLAEPKTEIVPTPTTPRPTTPRPTTLTPTPTATTPSPSFVTSTPSSTPNETPHVTFIPAPTPTPVIPQTGVTQWPIPVMALLGIGLFTLGWVLLRKSRGENET